MTRYESADRPEECPACASDRVARILYGLVGPDAKLLEEMDAGRTILGGCEVTDDDPSWQCLACGARIHSVGGRRGAD